MNKPLLCLLLSVCSAHLMHAQIYDPFLKTAKPATVASSGLLPPPLLLPPVPKIPSIVVGAVMNNKAFINGAWYRVGDRINNQEVTYIHTNFVGFKEGNRLTMIAVGGTRRVLGIKEVQ